jgi:signal peptidase I
VTAAALWAAGTVAGAAVAATLLVWGLRRRFCLVTVEGRSMAPAYADGDVVLARRLTPAAIDRGQVVVVEKPGPNGLWRTPEHGGALVRRRLGYVPAARVLGVAVRKVSRGGRAAQAG